MPITLKQIKKLPQGPGVYVFKRRGEWLYVGKATSLRDRVRSYLASDVATTRGVRVAGLPLVATSVAIFPTASVLEALILESALIKKHQPPYNTREKDDKSFLHIAITDEPWPRVLLTRFRANKLELNFSRFTRLLTGSDASKNLAPTFAYKIKYHFGPFPHGGELRAAMKIIRKIFPFRDRCLPLSGRLCFAAQLGLCPGVCTGAISRADYRWQIRRLALFLSGRTGVVLKGLRQAMSQAAKTHNFAMAIRFRDQLFALTHIEDVALLKRTVVGPTRIEAYDVAHLAGQETVGVMTVVKNGVKAPEQYRRFKLRGLAATRADDTANLYELLERRFKHLDWPPPDLIVVDGGQAQVNVARRALRAAGLPAHGGWGGHQCRVVGVVKDERHRPKGLMGDMTTPASWRSAMLLANNEAHRFALDYHRRRRDRVV